MEKVTFVNIFLISIRIYWSLPWLLFGVFVRVSLSTITFTILAYYYNIYAQCCWLRMPLWRDSGPPSNSTPCVVVQAIKYMLFTWLCALSRTDLLGNILCLVMFLACIAEPSERAALLFSHVLNVGESKTTVQYTRSWAAIGTMLHLKSLLCHDTV